MATISASRRIALAGCVAVSFALLCARPALAEMRVEVVQVFFRDAAPVAAELSKYSSEGGRIATDPLSNSLVIRDFPATIELMKEKLKKMDVRPRRVRITAGFIEKEKISASGVQWFFTDPDWSQGILPPGLDATPGMGIVSHGAAPLASFNRQFILLEGGAEGSIYVSSQIPDAPWFFEQWVIWGFAGTEAQFREAGSSFGITAKEGADGQMEIRLVPKLTRHDGGSDILMEKAHVLVLGAEGKTVVISGNVEKEDSFGKRFLSLLDSHGTPKEVNLVLGIAAE